MTYRALRKAGYTGKIYLVIDDEDPSEQEYRHLYGDEVLQFSKAEIAKTFDEGDNFQDRRAIIYARNACWELAKQVGCRYFVQLDDDYKGFEYRFDMRNNPCYFGISKTLDGVFTAMLDYFISVPEMKSIAMAQGGDYIGTGYKAPDKNVVPRLKRKCMNSFICDTERPFRFSGRINEDVNTYTEKGRKGLLFFTVMQAKLNQIVTQSNQGGMTDLYKDSGTYVKSFYSVMYCPSSVKVGTIKDTYERLHHRINWEHTVPKIVHESLRKP